MLSDWVPSSPVFSMAPVFHTKVQFLRSMWNRPNQYKKKVREAGLGIQDRVSGADAAMDTPLWVQGPELALSHG